MTEPSAAGEQRGRWRWRLSASRSASRGTGPFIKIRSSNIGHSACSDGHRGR